MLVKLTLSAELLLPPLLLLDLAVSSEQELRMPHFDAGETKADTAKSSDSPGNFWTPSLLIPLLLLLVAPPGADKKASFPPIF